MHLEYPKHVYRGEGEDRESVVVKNAEEEAAAETKGYAALPANPAPETPQAAAQAAGSAYLEYPKHVYTGDGDDRVSIVVKDADEEAAAAERGYAALAVPAADAPAEASKAKPKAPKASKAKPVKADTGE